MAATKDPVSGKPDDELRLSRAETFTLVFDKLETIRSEVEECDGMKLTVIRPRLARIALEARRAQQLIERQEAIAHSGHCVHCGKIFEEHGEIPSLRTDVEAGCGYLRALYVAVELETYQRPAGP